MPGKHKREPRTDRLDRLWDIPYGWLVLATAAAALAARVLINLVFWYRFGSHASSIVEVWYYTANPVRHTFMLQPWDLTVPILSSVIALDPKDPYHEVVICGWLLASLTVALVCFAGREVYRLGASDLMPAGSGTQNANAEEEERARRFGVAAGVVYGLSNQNLSITLASFTHDLVAFPLCGALIFALVRSANILRGHRGTLRAVPWIVVAGASAFLGSRIGPTIYGVLGCTLVGIALVLARGKMAGRNWIAVGVPALLFVVLMAFALLPGTSGWRADLRHLVDEHAKATRGIDAAAQAAAGAEDLIPISARKVLVAYNFLFMLVPPALAIAFRRRESVGLMFLAVGVPGMAMIQRVSRLADFGQALLLAGPLALAWGQRRRGWVPIVAGCYLLAVYACLVGLSGGDGSLATRIIGVLPWLAGAGKPWWQALVAMTAFGVATVTPLIIANRARSERRARRVALVAAALGLFVSGVFFLVLWPKSRTTQADWLALSQARAVIAEHSGSQDTPSSDDKTGARSGGGQILIPWSDGLMGWAVTGLDAACHVEKIDRAATLLYWCHDDEAAAGCRARGIQLVFWAPRYYQATLGENRTARQVITRVGSLPELFFGDSGWNERNQAVGGDPNMVYTLIALMGQPRDRLPELLPDFDLIAEAPDRNDPSRPGARVFALRAAPRPGYALPRPGVKSPALEAIERLEAPRK